MTLVALASWPTITLSVITILLSIILAMFILLHKGRGNGLSDLFGGGMSTSLNGTSVAERNLDRITIAVGVLWIACIIALAFIYRFG